MKKEVLYPLLFEPVYKERFWGGSFLKNGCGRIFEQNEIPVGESWEIFDRQDGSSTVENGILQGKLLHELVREFSSDLLGKASGYLPEALPGDDGKDKGEIYFPLIVKLIDAAQNLSLQVHPSLENCRILGKGEEKNEFWYVLHAEKDAHIYAGLRKGITKEIFQKDWNTNCHHLEHLLHSYPVRGGESCFIPAGKIHAAGAGVTLLEIHQNSDTTYRISDWGRVDQNHKARELHFDESMVCVDFSEQQDVCVQQGYSGVSPEGRNCLLNQKELCQIYNRKVSCPVIENTEEDGSFHLLSATDHAFYVETSSGKVFVPSSRTVLVPACTGQYRIIPVLKDGEFSDILLTVRKG